MKDLILVTTLFLGALLIWFFTYSEIRTIDESAKVDESIGKFSQTSVRIDIQYLKDIPAYEYK
jgi:hypothetical protein